MNKYVDEVMKRYDVEDAEKWREWVPRVPAIPMDKDWLMQPIPPFAGALARFVITRKDKQGQASVYLDVNNRLGQMGGPYWEVMGSGDEDPDRCLMDEVDKLVKIIRTSLGRLEKK